MGGNGSFASGATNSELGRKWYAVDTYSDIQIVQLKDKKRSNKLPEESHTPNRIYAVFERDGRDIKAIAKYGSDGKKMWEIHTADHDGLGAHFHNWENGRPERSWNMEKGRMRNVVHKLTPQMKKMLLNLRNYGSEDYIGK